MVATKTSQPSTPDGDDDRRALHVFLSDDAHDSWHRVASELGVSVSGMLQVIAFELGKDPADSALGPAVDGLVRRARKIDAERRRR